MLLSSLLRHVQSLTSVFHSLISIFDEDGGGNVDFQEFVSGLSAFSSKGNKEQKLAFAFKVYDIDRDGYISNGELFIVLKMMVGSNLKDHQLQQIVDKTLMEADLDKDGKISFEEFKKMVENTDVSMSMTLGMLILPHASLWRWLDKERANHSGLQTSSRWLDLHHEAACTIYPRRITFNSRPPRVQSPDTDHSTNMCQGTSRGTHVPE